MKILFCILFLFIFAFTYSLEKADSARTKLKAGATISLNSNGIAPIPAFSLDKPAVIAAISLVKGRFSYEPALSYALNMKPWILDSWLQYKIINKPAFEFKSGIIFSNFFSDYELPEDTILHQSQRYFTFTFSGVYRFTPNTALTIAYWNDRGQDNGTIKGHYINLIGERSDMKIGKHVLLAAAFQLFYINYDGNNDGLFISPRISSSIRNVPFSVFFQAIQALTSNISPFPEFRWNMGLAYML
jgi:hypothetical protein